MLKINLICHLAGLTNVPTDIGPMGWGRVKNRFWPNSAGAGGAIMMSSLYRVGSKHRQYSEREIEDGKTLCTLIDQLIHSF